MQNQFSGDADAVVMAGAVHGDITVNFPAPRRASALCQVPAGPMPYINNERQLHELDEWFAIRENGPRVVLVRGAPGSGRTALVSHWTQEHSENYPDGLFFVRLGAGPDEAEREGAALLELLLATEEYTHADIPVSLDGRAAWWRSWSAGKRIALVIDEALTASQVRSLLPGAGGSAVLVTEAGRLSALLASGNATRVDIDPMSDQAATQLLERIVGKDKVAGEPEAIDQLISLCEGSTIALCVVATMLADFRERPIGRLARKLTQDERALRELSKDTSLSVTVVFDAAYERLSPLARDCYRVLGVHPGTGDVSAAAIAAALGQAEDDVSDAMQSLLHAKLATETTEDRYLISGLVRQHAAAKAESPQALLRELISYYWAHAVTAAKLMMPDRVWHKTLLPAVRIADLKKPTVEQWIKTEQANLRVVVEAAYQLGELERVCQLGVALWPLHEHGEYPQDMAAVNRRGVRAAEELGDHLAAAVLGFQHGLAYRQRGHLDRAAELLSEASKAAARAGSADAEATALETLALVLLDQGELVHAGELLAQTVERALEIGDPRRMALAKFHLAKTRPPEDALPLLDEARAGLADEAYNLTKIDLWRGKKLTEAGRLTEAGDVLAQVSAAATEHDWHRERGEACVALADLALARGETGIERSHLEDAVEIFRHHGLTPQAVLAESRLG